VQAEPCVADREMRKREASRTRPLVERAGERRQLLEALQRLGDAPELRQTQAESAKVPRQRAGSRRPQQFDALPLFDFSLCELTP
jgi:hypothetical protein